MGRKPQPSEHLAIRTIFVEDARKAYAEALNRRVEKLTQQEKNIALVNHILKRMNNG